MYIKSLCKLAANSVAHVKGWTAGNTSVMENLKYYALKLGRREVACASFAAGLEICSGSWPT